MFFACILFASKPAMSQDATAIPSMMSVPLPGIFDGIGPDELSNKVRHVSAARSKSLGGSLYGRQVRRMWTRVLAKNGDGDLMGVEGLRMFVSCHGYEKASLEEGRGGCATAASCYCMYV